MIRSGWAGALPRRLMLIAAAALVPVLAGCEAGNNAPTQEFHYPTATAGLAVGHLSIRNVFVLGASLGSSLRPGQNASLFFAVINDGAPDRLVSISAPGSAASVVLPAGGVPVVDQRPVFLSGPAPAAYLKNLTKPLLNGSDITLVLNFAKQGPVRLQVPVMPRATHFSTFVPAPSPSATATAPNGASPSPSPSSTS